MISDSPFTLPLLRQLQPSWRWCQYSLVVSILLILFYPFHAAILPSVAQSSSPPLARSLSAQSLLSRPISRDLTTIPKIIHQTWFPTGSNLTQYAQSWVRTIRTQNPDWEHVLWDDETNRMLVERYFPWFLQSYLRLPKEIHRADVARNFYMYLFGGMYADVDTEALLPVDPLFAAHATSLSAHQVILSSASSSRKTTTQRAFLGRMGRNLDVESAGAVPNGWMASPPGHPFWLLPVLDVLDHADENSDDVVAYQSVESLTGPEALGRMINRYFVHFRHESLRRYVCETIQQRQPTWQLFCRRTEDEVADDEIRDALVLLPEKQIYPYSWVDDGKDSVCLAAGGNPMFDPEECKKLMDVEAWPSYFITYCTHAW